MDYLDGIRALAALFVVFHHTYLNGIDVHSLPQHLFNIIGQGHLSVDVFIVISGFCLMLPVARGGQLKGGSKTFYLKRARRILPTYYAAFLLALFLLVLRSLPAHHPFPFTARGIIVNLLLLQDVFVLHVHPIHLVVLGEQFAVPFWSVSAEWQIYFLFPPLVLLWRRRGMGAVFGLTAALGYSLALLMKVCRPDLDWSHTCPWYLLLFGMGMGAAVIEYGTERVTSSRVWATAAAVCASLLLVLLVRYPLSRYTDYIALLPTTDPLMGALTASGIILLCRRQKAGSPNVPLKILSWKPLVFIGTFSYSIYLIHWPLLMAAIATSKHLHLSPHRLDVVMLLFVPPVIVFCSYLFFLVCEKPFLVRRRDETFSEVATDAALSPAP